MAISKTLLNITLIMGCSVTVERVGFIEQCKNSLYFPYL